MFCIMWNSTASSIKKNKIYAKTPVACAPDSPVTPGSLAVMKQHAKILVRSNDPRVTIDPPALVPYTIDSEVNAQFLEISKNNLLLFLYTDFRTEFCEKDGPVMFIRHVYLLITDERQMLVTSEPSWLKALEIT